MKIANPLWLWGLLGLLLPIAIHLLSRKAGRVIYVGSIRHLLESNSAQFSSIRLNEILLLVLRILIIIFLVLLLAELFVNRQAQQKGKWVIIEDGLTPERIGPALNDLVKDGFKMRRLQTEFPLLEDTKDSSIQRINYWRMAEDLRNVEADSVVVFSHNFLRGFRGPMASLPPHVNWIGIDPEVVDEAVSAVMAGNDSVSIRRVRSSKDMVAFSSSTVSTTAQNPVLTINRPDTVNVSILFPQSFSYDADLIQAVMEAIDELTPHYIFVERSNNRELPKNRDIIFWLFPEPPPASDAEMIAYGTCEPMANVKLLERRNPLIAECGGGQPEWWLTRRLHEEDVIREDLTVLLGAIVMSHLPAPEFDDRRTGNVNLLTSSTAREHVKSVAGQTSSQPISGLIVALLLATLIIERVVATKRRQ